jgi:hypothetical protein
MPFSFLPPNPLVFSHWSTVPYPSQGLMPTSELLHLWLPILECQAPRSHVLQGSAQPPPQI